MKNDIDVMMLFKFDIKNVKLNFKAIASMEFSFDIKFCLLCSYGLSRKTVENCFKKILEKIQFHEFRSIEIHLRSIK